MIKREQDHPVFVLLPLIVSPAGLVAPQVAQLASSLEGHAKGHCLPTDEDPTRQLSVEPGLAPAGEEHRTPERVEWADVASCKRVWSDGRRALADGGGILRRSRRKPPTQ